MPDRISLTPLHSHPEFPSSDLLLSAIIDSSDDAIISKNLDGIITSWNGSAEQMFGYCAEEMIGRSVTTLIPPDRLEEEPRILARLRRGERVSHFESVRVRKNGELFDVSLTISPIKDGTGRIIGASKIARDISDQKRAERKLAAAYEEIKRADRMKVEFVSTLSHELRTPLNAIVGWIQVLREEDVTPQELAEGLKVIERNTRAQSQLIEDLLDMSRIESGNIRLDLQNLDIVAVVNAAIEAVRPAAAAKHIRLRSPFSDIGGYVMGDKTRLQQIVSNILNNAVKFTPEHGRVEVTIERIDSHVELAVTDTGQGIAPEFLGMVFDRFRQADASTTRRHGGLGLGLAIVKHLTELHGGRVRALSDGKGMGATFVVALPLVSVPHHEERGLVQTALAGEAASKVDLGGIKVLVVDDDLDTLNLFKHILESRHAEVRAGQSVNEAMLMVETFTPDVVLTDIGMPEHDGYDLLGQLRKSPGGSSIPVVAVSAFARPEDRSRTLRAGFEMHVSKPIEAGDLLAVVSKLTKRGH